MRNIESDDRFASGLRNIRHAIEAGLADSGIKRQSLGDTSRGSARSAPGMVIVDVGANDKMARVTFTREEIEDCSQYVDAYCVRAKIERMVAEFLR